jgi:hypothetical protein
MAIRYHYDNLIDYAGVAISESSEVSTLPSSNVANDLRTKVWRTGTSTADEWIVFDLGSAKAVSAVILLDHTLTAGDSAITLEGHTADSWATPAYSNTLTYAASTIYEVFAAETYRYWRVKFTKASAGVSRDIGRIFLGPYVTASREVSPGDYTENTVDRTVTRRTLGGQSYSWLRDSYRSLTLGWKWIEDAQKTEFSTLASTVGSSVPWFLYLSGRHDTPLYVKLRDLFAYKNAGGVDGAYLWDVQMIVDEEL